jgi:hypothetical protein
MEMFENGTSFISVTDLNYKSVILCQRPLWSSFCIDSSSLTSAMTKVGESFTPVNIQTSGKFSTFNCIQFCIGQSANVSKISFFTKPALLKRM